jgi:hypothetical protein
MFAVRRLKPLEVNEHFKAMRGDFLPGGVGVCARNTRLLS